MVKIIYIFGTDDYFFFYKKKEKTEISMNEQQLVACKKIFEAVVRRPVARLFWDISSEVANKDIEKPISFSFINEKLGKGLYKSPGAFVNDMRLVFLNGDTYDKNSSIKPAAISLLIEDFEKALAIYSPSSLSLNMKLRMVLGEIEEITESTKCEPLATTAQKGELHAPCCNFLANQESIDPENISSLDLKNEITLLKSSKLLLKTIQFIHNLQPEAICIGQGVSIIFSLLSTENIEKIHKFIVKLIREAASGEIDGLEPSFLDSRDTSIIQQINYSKGDHNKKGKDKTKKKVTKK